MSVFEISQVFLLQCPALVRLDGVGAHGEDDLMAVDAAGTVLVDRLGHRLVVSERTQVVSAPRRRGPYRLEDDRRRIVALSA